jgi:hypothetical protein
MVICHNEAMRKKNRTSFLSSIVPLDVGVALVLVKLIPLMESKSLFNDEESLGVFSFFKVSFEDVSSVLIKSNRPMGS